MQRPVDTAVRYGWLLAEDRVGLIAGSPHCMSQQPADMEREMREVFGEGRPRDALTIAKRYLANFGTTTDPALSERVASVTGTWLTLSARLDPASAPRLCDSVFERYEAAADGIPAVIAGTALNPKLTVLLQERSFDQADAVLEQQTHHFLAHTSARATIDLALRLLNSAEVVISAGKASRAVNALQTVIEQFAEDDQPLERQVRAHAELLLLVERVYNGREDQLMPEMERLAQEGETALAPLEAAITRWADKPLWRRARVVALNAKVEVLTALGEEEKATEAKRMLLKDVTDEPLPGLQDHLEQLRDETTD